MHTTADAPVLHLGTQEMINSAEHLLPWTARQERCLYFLGSSSSPTHNTVDLKLRTFYVLRNKPALVKWISSNWRWDVCFLHGDKDSASSAAPRAKSTIHQLETAACLPWCLNHWSGCVCIRLSRVKANNEHVIVSQFVGLEPHFVHHCSQNLSKSHMCWPGIASGLPSVEQLHQSSGSCMLPSVSGSFSSIGHWALNQSMKFCSPKNRKKPASAKVHKSQTCQVTLGLWPTHRLDIWDGTLLQLPPFSPLLGHVLCKGLG